MLNEIGNYFLDKAVEQVKVGKKFTFDSPVNIVYYNVHEMRSDNQNKSSHAMATTLVFYRVSVGNQPDDKPKHSLAACDMLKLITLTNEEVANRIYHYTIFAARILCEFLPEFSFLKELVPAHLPTAYSQEMGDKSVVIPFPVQMKDEKKYCEVVNVLEQLETWVLNIYKQAGLASQIEEVQPSMPQPMPPPNLQPSSRPDQPLSHVSPVADPNDPIAGVKVPCIGDQLTRVRFSGAKDLRAGSHSASDRFDDLYPFRVADWHCKQSLLKVFYEMLSITNKKARDHSFSDQTDISFVNFLPFMSNYIHPYYTYYP